MQDCRSGARPGGGATACTVQRPKSELRHSKGQPGMAQKNRLCVAKRLRAILPAPSASTLEASAMHCSLPF